MVDVSAVARVVGIDVQYKNLSGGRVFFLPQRIAVFAQGRSDVTYPLTKFQVTSWQQVAARMGYGCPAHLVARELFPDNGDGVGSIPVTIYPMADGYEAVAAVAVITPSGTQLRAGEYRVRIGGILSRAFVLAKNASLAERCDAIVAAINGVLEMPMIATDNTTNVGLEAKWAGASGNDIVVEVIGPTDGTVFGISQPSGGLVNPEVDDALGRMGSVWETYILNALNIEDEVALDAYQTFGDGRWGELEHRPLTVITGVTDDTVDEATAISATRTDDKVNFQVPAPGSPDLPFLIAARALARIAKVANNNPPHEYSGQRLSGRTAGDDGVQWDFLQRDQAVKAGSSTTTLRDGVITLSDTVMFYNPVGDPTPAYRYLVDICKLQQIIFNIALIFANDTWDGAPLIPDDQPTRNPTAKKPKMAIAELALLMDELGLDAIISDPEFAKASITAEISAPKRLDVEVTVKLSGNANQIPVKLNFGFLFSTAAAA